MSSGVWRVPSFDRGNKAVERISEPLFPRPPQRPLFSHTARDTQQRSGSAPFADTALSGEASAGRRFVAAGGGHLPGRRREARDAAMAAAPGWALGLPARRSRCHPRAHTLPVAAMAARTARPRDAAHGQRADGALQRRLRSRVQRLSAAGGASLQRAGARLWARPPRELRPGRRRARRRARGAEAEQRAEPATRRAARHAWRDVSRTCRGRCRLSWRRRQDFFAWL